MELPVNKNRTILEKKMDTPEALVKAPTSDFPLPGGVPPNTPFWGGIGTISGYFMIS